MIGLGKSTLEGLMLDGLHIDSNSEIYGSQILGLINNIADAIEANNEAVAFALKEDKKTKSPVIGYPDER
jgi:hypothetical protein